jgi:hypothetical protein
MRIRELALLATLLLPAAAFGQEAEDGIIGWFDNYDDAMAEAKKTGKPIFLEFRCSP